MLKSTEIKVTIYKSKMPEFNRKLLDKKPRTRVWRFTYTFAKLDLLVKDEWMDFGRHIKLYEVAQVQWWTENIKR